MAKKKKPAGNPARGFATTSIASKPKQEKTVATAPTNGDAPVLTKESTTTIETPSQSVASKTEAVGKVVEQTPEELEAQLERDELQLLVEKHAPKVRRDAHRNVLKFQTDRRVLRGQSHSMTVHDWLPNEILDSIVSLAQAESNDSNRRQGSQPLLKILSEEDAMSKLWTLDMTLQELGFSKDQVQPVLIWLCASAATVDSSASVWGLQEALEWLALNQVESHNFSYDEQTPKRSTIETPDISRPGEPSSHANSALSRACASFPSFNRSSHVKCTDLGLVTPTLDSSTDDSKLSESLTSSGTKAAGLETPVSSIGTPEAEQNDLHVSDLDSDIELDELVPTYLKIKSRLYEIDPELADPISTRKQAKGKKAQKGSVAPVTKSPAVRKLISQLQQISSDALFDEREAEVLWPAIRNQIAQDKATKRSQQPDFLQAQSVMAEPAQATEPRPASSQVAKSDDSEDEVDLLGGMFSAVPDQVAPSQSETKVEDSAHVTLRDFGKSSGLTPRRLLEEAVRSRLVRPTKILFIA